jgi:hypothetical protein
MVTAASSSVLVTATPTVASDATSWMGSRLKAYFVPLSSRTTVLPSASHWKPGKNDLNVSLLHGGVFEPPRRLGARRPRA